MLIEAVIVGVLGYALYQLYRLARRINKSTSDR